MFPIIETSRNPLDHREITITVPPGIRFTRMCKFTKAVYIIYNITGGLLRVVIGSAAMENASLSSDIWNNMTTSSSKDDDDVTSNLHNVRDIVLKIIYSIIGTVGVLDNVCRRP